MMTPVVRYPEVKVQLTGQNGNAFNLIGLVQQALRRAGVPRDEIRSFQCDAISGDYDHVLQTCMKWVSIT